MGENPGDDPERKWVRNLVMDLHDRARFHQGGGGVRPKELELRHIAAQSQLL